MKLSTPLADDMVGFRAVDEVAGEDEIQGETVGFYIRKSIKAGPFRFNLSKSGLGVSTGVPGFRVGTGPRGNYVHMGRNGIYYRASLGGGVANTGRPPTSPNNPGSPVSFTPSGIVMENMTGATAVCMAPTGPGDLVAQLNTASSRFSFCWPTAIAGVVIGLAVGGYGALILALILIPLCVWLYFNDESRRTVVVFYDVQDAAEQWFQALTDQWRWLTESQRTWRVTQAGAVLTPYQHKRNAGASALISSIAAAASFSGPDRLKTNITIPSIVADKSALYFLPDRLLVRDGKRFSDVSYEHLGVYQTTQRFIEESVPPADAQHVDTTWTYVNKDGGPDRRFNNNRILPVMLYGRIVLTSPTGLYWIIQTSRHQAAEPVAYVISLGGHYAEHVRQSLERNHLDRHQIAARADRENQLFLKGDARGIYGQYAPQPLEGDNGEGGQANTRQFDLVFRAGKPRLWRERPDRDEVTVQVDIRPSAPDARWWSCFAHVVAERHFHAELGEVARGGVAAKAANAAGVPATIAEIDSIIDAANDMFINTYARDEVEAYVTERRSAQLANEAARADTDLEALAELLAKPDAVQDGPSLTLS